ncbi:5331_t:CDS:2 [Acaulospora colombiana]|uniref:5331_t:CDS:1 n=1 Tax=Acaulospora colombiana TaxID=27376 RepID=A0ACA9MVS3_9GLOM|nr:5331_t:CDS:2 [Acaulospora colombiana]
MTEVNNKSVINEAIVKDNISGAGTTNSYPSQELCESIVSQVLDKKIQISLSQLLEIVKPEIQQDIINSIGNPYISRHTCIPLMKRVELERVIGLGAGIFGLSFITP